jgi:hypothetical protein
LTDLPPSDVHHFFKILSADNETTILAVASLRVEQENSAAEDDFKDLNLFIVLDSSPRMNASFVVIDKLFHQFSLMG